MIISDRKKAATVILSRMKGGAESIQEAKPTETDPNDSGSALHPIAEELMQAIHSKDASSVVSALRAFLAEHEVSEGEE